MWILVSTLLYNEYIKYKLILLTIFGCSIISLSNYVLDYIRMLSSGRKSFEKYLTGFGVQKIYED